MIAMGRDRVAAIACAAIAAALFALTFSFEQMPEGITRGMGAEVFPRLVLSVILLLCLLLALGGRRQQEPETRIPPTVFGTSAVLVAFMALLEVIGMLAAMLLFLPGLGWLWGERRAGHLVLFAALLTAAIWAVFVRGFGIPLPAGMLGRMLGA
jgi:hypothetical protein